MIVSEYLELGYDDDVAGRVMDVLGGSAPARVLHTAMGDRPTNQPPSQPDMTTTMLDFEGRGRTLMIFT